MEDTMDFSEFFLGGVVAAFGLFAVVLGSVAVWSGRGERDGVRKPAREGARERSDTV